MLKYKLIHRLKLVLEKLRGIEFTKITPVSELELDPKKVFPGSSSGGSELWAAFSKLDIKPTDSIPDIGSGKGGAMNTFYRFPFARIDGIEISKELVNIANANIIKLNLKKTQIFCQNSTKFSQYGLYNFFYLYNPFDINTLKETVLLMMEQQPEFTLIYNNPIDESVLDSLGLICFGETSGTFGNKIKFYKYSQEEKITVQEK